MDIRDIKISLIADEFIKYLDQMKKIDVYVTSDFLLMASTLMELKSKALLARDEDEQAELEEAKQKLVQQIEEYERVKDFVSILEHKEEEAKRIFKAKAKRDGIKKEPSKEVPHELYEAFKSAYEDLKLREKVYRVKGEKYSIAKRVEYLYSLLKEEGVLFINNVLSCSEDKIDLIVNFLSILEIIKLNYGILKHHEEELCLFLNNGETIR